MRIESIMTREVVTTGPDASLVDVAHLLVAHGVSGLPVCGPGGQVIGVITESDILQTEQGIAPDLSGPLAWLARQFDPSITKIAARTAGDSMTAPALTIGPREPVSRAARLMIEHRINCLPVVAADRLVGIVSRADLVRAFTRPDDEIAREIRDDVVSDIMLLGPEDLQVSMQNGCAVMTGRVKTPEDAQVLERCVRHVPGVLDVDLRL